MRRMTFAAFAMTTVVAVFSVPAADAQVRLINGQIVRPSPFPGGAQRMRPIANPQAQQIYYQPKRIVIDPNQRSGAPAAINGQAGQARRLPPQNGYPYINAPMNPVPVPNVPYQIGGTVITNQAFSPHEMLYPHTYRAMYPPFYYRSRGFWIGGPKNLLTRDNWELQGTEVEIEYRSSAPLTSRFRNPFDFWPFR